MFIIYQKITGDVFGIFESVEHDDDGILWGFVGQGKNGYHPNCFPEVHELTNEELNNYDFDKEYVYRNGELIEKVNITSEDDINLMLTDQEYRLLMLELDV